MTVKQNKVNAKAEIVAGAKAVMAVTKKSKKAAEIVGIGLAHKIPHSATLKRLVSAGDKACAKLAATDSGKAFLTDTEKLALQGLKAAFDYLGRELHYKGNQTLTPLGHNAASQAGQVDLALLDGLKAGKVSLSFIALKVAQAGCATRKSELVDNNTLAKRIVSHLKNVSGNKRSSLPKRLERVGKTFTPDLFDHFDAVYQLYNEQLKAGKY